MPELSCFLGIVIMMYFNDHNPPHFHAKYNEYRASITISNLSVLEGSLPPRILGIVMEWAEIHKEELINNWELLKNTGSYNKIAPLV
jgi:hypothetical protein